MGKYDDNISISLAKVRISEQKAKFLSSEC